MASPRTLDPAVARIVEALADLMVDRDIARLRAVAPMPMPMPTPARAH